MDLQLCQTQIKIKIQKNKNSKTKEELSEVEKLKDERKENPNYGYRRITAILRKQGLLINKKKVQILVQKLNLQVTSFSRKTRKYSSYKETIGRVADNKINRNFKVG